MTPDRTGSEALRSRPPLAWGLLLLPALAQIALHLLTTGRYGIFRDEYYYLACAARPDWGYVDQPPLSIWILQGWVAVFGDSVQSIRVLPTLSGAGLVFLTGAIAAEMGGRRWAQFLAGLGAAVGGAGLVICGFYSMNAFDILFWAAAYLVVVRVARTGDGGAWLTLGLILGFGLLNKIGLLVFGTALAGGLLLSRHRRQLLDGRLWFAGALALAFLLPYFLWNLSHDWAGLEFIENARAYKIAAMPPLDYLKEVVLENNPAAAVIWLPGLLWLLFARGRPFRVVAFMFLITTAILMLQKSKPYYLASSFCVLLAAGGVAWERWTDRGGLRWVPAVLAANLAAGAVIMAPLAVPLKSPEDLVPYLKRLGIMPRAAEVGHTSVLPQHFSDRQGWEELARTVSAAYSGLTAGEQARCVIVASNYGEAGALEYWSRRYPLPPVYSGHNSYWFWGPPPPSRNIFIAVGYDRDDLEPVFRRVVSGAEAVTPWALESRIPVWICRGPTRTVESLWRQLKHFI
jgi:4-amino-4-deoxy-L-arabinose transferase-like glycosyltransferase